MTDIKINHTVDQDFVHLQIEADESHFKVAVLDPLGVSLDLYKNIQANTLAFQMDLEKATLDHLVSIKSEVGKITGYDIELKTDNPIYSVVGMGQIIKDNPALTSFHLKQHRTNSGWDKYVNDRNELIDKIFADVNN